MSENVCNQATNKLTSRFCTIKVCLQSVQSFPLCPLFHNSGSVGIQGKKHFITKKRSSLGLRFAPSPRTKTYARAGQNKKAWLQNRLLTKCIHQTSKANFTLKLGVKHVETIRIRRSQSSVDFTPKKLCLIRIKP